MDKIAAEALLEKLEPGGIGDPANVKLLEGYSLQDREDFSFFTGTMVLYLGDEVTKVRHAEEQAALRAIPVGHEMEALNGINIGCGDRTISKFLLPVDVMRRAPLDDVSGAHHALTENALLSAPDNLPFKENSIDYIVALHMLEHVENPVAVVDYWLSIIKPGGGLGLVLPNWKYTWDARNDDTLLGHKWNPTPDLLKDMHKKHWSDRADIEHVSTYSYKISFDIVLRKFGSFEPFMLSSIGNLQSGKMRASKGLFLHGE